MSCVILVSCTIEAQAYGANTYNQKRYAYVKLNGEAVWHASWRGEHPRHTGSNMFIVDPSSCTLQEWRNFDTHAVMNNPAALLRDYLQGLGDGTLLVGVSCNEASKELDAAEATLSALGADVSDVGWRGAWVFVAEIGDPSKTLLDKELTQEAAYARQPQVRGV